MTGKRNYLRTKLIEYTAINGCSLGSISGNPWSQSSLSRTVSGRLDGSLSPSGAGSFLPVNGLWHDEPFFFRFDAIQLAVNEFLNGRYVEGILFIGKAD